MVVTPCSVGVVVGSLRSDSVNRRLSRAVAELMSDRLTCSEIPLEGLPMYNGDLEPNRPVEVDAFTDAVRSVDAILVVTPEYNRSLPAVLKNAIDWGSKPQPSNVWLDKPVASTGVSPGAIGTAAVQLHLRQVLGALGAAVMGGEAYLTARPDLFDEASGRLSDPSTEDFIRSYLNRFADFAGALREVK